MSQMPGFNGGLMPPMPMPFEVENIFSEKGDEKRVAIFYVRPVNDAAKSIAAGRPISVDQVFCRHHEIGDKLTIHDEPATETLKRRYARQWAHFQQGRGEEHVGTPLEVLFPDQPSLILNLKAGGIHTVEHLAELTDTHAASIGMGAVQWRQKARAFIDKANDTAIVTKMDSENAKLREEIDALRQQMQMMVQAQNSMARPGEEPASPRRGRPPKVRTADNPDEEID